MRSFLPRLAIVMLGCVILSGADTAIDWKRAGDAWWAHVQWLADDARKGRFTGSPEFDSSAQYVIDQFQKAGLQPPNNGGFSQSVALERLTLDEGKSRIELVGAAGTHDIKLGDEAIIGLARSSGGKVEASLAFIGYGLSAPTVGHDDLADINLKGKIAVFLSGGPKTMPGNLRSYYASADVRWSALARAGAIGEISIANPKAMDVPWARQAANRFTPHLVLADPTLDYTPGERFSAHWNPGKIDDLLAGSGHTFADILAAADADRPVPHFEIPLRLRAESSIQRTRLKSQNVVGIWPGSDSKLKTEFIGLSAHLDHLGVGKPVNGDSIFNGAMDNASGIASLIEIARALGRERPAIKRSLVFLVFTGEEEGMLGSHYLASHFPANGHVVADINMDMYLPLFPLKYLEVQGLAESTLGDDVRAIARARGVEVQADKEPDRNRFIRSDQYSFIRLGSPSLAFKFGFVPGTPEDKLYHEWFKVRYHAVSDDTSQPVDPAAAAQFDVILLALAERVANAPSAPAWHPDSFFNQLAQQRYGTN